MMQIAGRAITILQRRLQRRLRRRKEAHGLVLTYHRVCEGTGPDPWHLRVSPAHFREQVDVLSRVADVVPLTEMSRHLRVKRGDRPIVSITFDDGYADNLTEALPLLEHYGLPATVFVATSWIGHEEPFWWDALASIVLGTHPLPAELELETGPSTFRWSADRKQKRAGCISAAERMALTTKIRQYMLELEDGSRAKFAGSLASLVGRPLEADDGSRPMTVDELKRLNTSDLIDIGAHTMTHCSLPTRPESEQAAEIFGSRATCEKLLGFAPNTFSYPYGDHNSTVRRLVAEAGFELACTNEQELAWANVDPLLTARFVVRNWDGRHFKRRLHHEWLP